MFTAEIKINGVLVAHVFGRNVTAKETKAGEADIYETQVIEVNEREQEVERHLISHHREDGICKLVEQILARHNEEKAKK